MIKPQGQKQCVRGKKVTNPPPRCRARSQTAAGVCPPYVSGRTPVRRSSPFQVIRLANDGLTSARNQPFAPIQRDYICFLESSHVRHNWSFGAIAPLIAGDTPDQMLCPSSLPGVRGHSFRLIR
jgi:hypothetical protein